MRHNTSGRATNHASKKYGLIGQKNSTFFPSLAPDVKMEDDDVDNDYDADFYRHALYHRTIDLHIRQIVTNGQDLLKCLWPC